MDFNSFSKENEEKLGKFLGEYGIGRIDRRFYSELYYMSGVPEIDQILEKDKFYDTDLLFFINSYENGIVVCLALRNQLALFIGGFWRDSIIEFQKSEEKNIIIPKFSRTKQAFIGAITLGGVAGIFQAEAMDYARSKKRTYKLIGRKSSSGFEYNLVLKNGNSPYNIKMAVTSKNDSVFDGFVKKHFQKDIDLKDFEGGCFIATACYCDFYSEEVMTLRYFRDSILNKSDLGKGIIRLYYKISPAIQKRLIHKKLLSVLIRDFILNPLVFIIRKFSS